MSSFSLPSLPSDIFSLLPQWLDMDTYLQLPQVCKTWHRLFALPEALTVYVECWDNQEDLEPSDMRETVIVTVRIGRCGLPLPSLSMKRIGDWRDCYHASYALIPTREIVSKHRGQRRWRLHKSEYLFEGPLGLVKPLLCAYNDVYLCSQPGEYCALDVKVIYDLGPSLPSVDLHPTQGEIDEAFCSYLVEDVSYQPPCLPHLALLALNSEGVYCKYSLVADRWSTLYWPLLPSEYMPSLYISVKHAIPYSIHWGERYAVVYERVAAYVLRRMQELGLPLRDSL